MPHLRQYTIVLLMILALAASVLVSRSDTRHIVAGQRSASIQGCERGNGFRSQANQFVPALDANNQGLLAFIDSAKKARLASGTPDDLQTALEYSEIEARVKFAVHYAKVPLVDCQAAYPKP